MVSVVVPVWNRKELLGRCLDSIAAQSWRPLEVIVVDNGSDDGSYEYACDWAALHSSPAAPSAEGETALRVKVVREMTRGASQARNRGLASAQGDYCIFFDSDDVMRPTLVERGVETLRRHPEARIVCWKCRMHLLDGSVRISPFYPERALECHLVHSLLRTQGYMAPTRLFRSAGGWNPALPCWNDLEAGVRLLLAAGVGAGENTVCGIPDTLAEIYSQRESITSDSFSGKAGEWEKSLESVRSLLAASALPDKYFYLKIVAYRKMILAAQYEKESRPELASSLLEDAMASPVLRRGDKLLLRLLYRFTAAGGRGAWKIARLFFSPSHRFRGR